MMTTTTTTTTARCCPSYGEAEEAERRARLGKRNRKLEARTKEVFDKLYDRETMEAHYQTSADEVADERTPSAQLDLEAGAPSASWSEARHILGRLFPTACRCGGEGGGAVPMATGGKGEDAQGIKAFSAAIANVLKRCEGEETVASKGKKDGEDGEGGEKEGEDGEKEGDASWRQVGWQAALELSLIEHFRKEDYALLTAAHLALIPELDLEYAHLQTAKAALPRAAQPLGGGVPELDERLDGCTKQHTELPEVNDVQVLLGHEMDEAGVGADGATAEAAEEGDDATAKRAAAVGGR